MNTPQYILDLLNHEIRSIQEALLQKVAAKYDLDVSLLIQECLPVSSKNISMTSPKETCLRIYKQQKPKQITEGARCMARVWNRGKGGQCTRSAKEGCFCSQHQHTRKHGSMEHPPDKNLFPSNVRAIHKGI